MKAQILALALVLGSTAGLTHAAEFTTADAGTVVVATNAGTLPMDVPAVSKTRKDVYQELAIARRSGDYDRLRAQYRGH